jgi:hypothetical protein
MGSLGSLQGKKRTFGAFFSLNCAKRHKLLAGIVLAFLTALLFAVLVLLALTGLSPKDLRDLLGDLPRHNSFQYINRDSLPETWFMKARNTLEDPSVYIVLSNTKSAASKVIARFTGGRYNHVSLAFDAALETLVSYNGGEGRGKPGMNPENPAEQLKVPDSAMAVYRLPAKAAQKQRIIAEIQRINAQGSSYNLLGLLTKRSVMPNIMFCSQFVYAMLDSAALNPFEKTSGKVKPMDFVNLDAEQRLALIDEINFEKRQIFFQSILDRRSNTLNVLIR